MHEKKVWNQYFFLIRIYIHRTSHKMTTIFMKMFNQLQLEHLPTYFMYLVYRIFLKYIKGGPVCSFCFVQLLFSEVEGRRHTTTIVGLQQQHRRKKLLLKAWPPFFPITWGCGCLSWHWGCRRGGGGPGT